MKYLHVWVHDNSDEGMLICSNCDTYKGSKSSLRDCSAAFDNITPLDGKGTE